jgi:hypothetical protein
MKARSDHRISHVAGKANSPITVPAPVNDHRARLTVDQYDWPKTTLENSERSPLLTRAGCIRGFADTIVYFIETFLLPGAELFETLDAYLGWKLCSKWWKDPELTRFKPTR